MNLKRLNIISQSSSHRRLSAPQRRTNLTPTRGPAPRFALPASLYKGEGRKAALPQYPTPNTEHRTPNAHSAFTLIEMLVVIAILGILFGLLLIPLVQSFHFVSREQDEITLHNVTGDSMRMVSSQIAEAMQVTLFPGDKTHIANSLRIDLILPASAVLNQPSYKVTNPSAGSGGEPGQLRETFFVGLANPSIPYNNPKARQISGGTYSAQPTDENEYVLWRAIYDLADPNDPVTKAIGTSGYVRYNSSGSYTGNADLSDPYFFDDSLAPLQFTAAGTPFIPAVSAPQQALLSNMRKYTARLPDKVTPVAAELTPVAVLGHLDAVRSRWDTGTKAWIIDPRVSFLPSPSQNQEALTGSELGTQFQASRGQWGVPGGADQYGWDSTGKPALSLYGLDVNGNPYTPVYWGDPSKRYLGPQFDATTSVFNGDYGAQVGTIPAVSPAPTNVITIMNGPQAGTTTNNPTLVMPYFIDPRTGRVTFTQFQVTENFTISDVTLPQVYHLYYPSSDPNNLNFAKVIGINPAVPGVRPQLVPYSDSLTVNGLPYHRLVGNLDVSQNVGTAYQVSQGVYKLSPGDYAINYVANPDLAMEPQAPQPSYPEETPLIEVPRYPTDPNVANGSTIQLTYSFTFSTLDATGHYLAQAAATYSSQQFVHIQMGFRKFDESNASPSDYALATSVGSSNRVNEQPGAE